MVLVGYGAGYLSCVPGAPGQQSGEFGEVVAVVGGLHLGDDDARPGIDVFLGAGFIEPGRCSLDGGAVAAFVLRKVVEELTFDAELLDRQEAVSNVGVACDPGDRFPCTGAADQDGYRMQWWRL